MITEPLQKTESKPYTKDISGTYKTVNDEDRVEPCRITLVIFKNKKGYNYHLTTDARNVTGKAVYSKNYITLQNIEWDEYEGDISAEEESSELPEIPKSIDGEIINDTITIQNYGNAMNSYIKLSECGRKYIRLAKQ